MTAVAICVDGLIDVPGLDGELEPSACTGCPGCPGVGSVSDLDPRGIHTGWCAIWVSADPRDVCDCDGEDLDRAEVAA